MRNFMTIAALGVALLAGADLDAAARHAARLVRVVDGDTLRVDIDLDADVTLRNQAVRILGIDAPELHGPERPEGLKSKAALEKFLRRGGLGPPAGGQSPPLQIELHGKDKYGRWLGDVFAGGENAALWMLKNAHARVYQIGRRALPSPAVPSSAPQAAPTPPRPEIAVNPL